LTETLKESEFFYLDTIDLFWDNLLINFDLFLFNEPRDEPFKDIEDSSQLQILFIFCLSSKISEGSIFSKLKDNLESTPSFFEPL